MSRKSRLVGIALAGTLTLAGCGSSTDHKAALDDAARSYASAYLSGNGADVYAMLSERCKTHITADQMNDVTTLASVKYGASKLTEQTVQVDGNHGTVTQHFDTPAINVDDQPWSLENGHWHWDAC